MGGLDRTHSERGTVRNSDREIGEDSEDAVSGGRLKGEVMRDLVDG